MDTFLTYCGDRVDLDHAVHKRKFPQGMCVCIEELLNERVADKNLAIGKFDDEGSERRRRGSQMKQDRSEYCRRKGGVESVAGVEGQVTEAMKWWSWKYKRAGCFLDDRDGEKGA